MAETTSPNPASSNNSLQAKAVAATLEVKGPSRSLMMDAWYRLVRNKAAVAGMIVVGLFFLIAALAPLLSPHNPLGMNSGKDYLPPSWVEKASNGKAGNPSFLLGTDTLGRDVL